MAVHDWTRVEAGIFHAFHHSWIEEIARVLNRGLLPPQYYALPEQHAAGFGPDVLTLQGGSDCAPTTRMGPPPGTPGGVLLAPPKLQPIAETELGFYRRKQSTVTVRHVSGDRIVAMLEIVSPGNKSSRAALRSLVEKAAALLERQIHLLVVDLHPPGRREPQGIHAAIWEEIAGEEIALPPEKPLTLAAYEARSATAPTSCTWRSATRCAICRCFWNPAARSRSRSRRRTAPPWRKCPGTGAACWKHHPLAAEWV